MLFSLYIRNFALIEELSIEFIPGLTIITGETGAGKSILIGALSLVLGERASSDLVRSGSNKAIIEAVFKEIGIKKINTLLKDTDIEQSPELILRRELSSTGQSRCFINDTPCTVAILKQVGELLIDLHGQHEHQLLLHADTHETLLDDFAGTAPEVTTYREIRKALQAFQQKMALLDQEVAESREKKEILDFQLNELNTLDLKKGEEEAVETEITLLENAETLFTLSTALNDQLYECEHSVYSSISEALHSLEKLADIDKHFAIYIEEIRTAKSIVDEFSRFNRSYITNIDFSPGKLDSLRNRQLQLQRISKKYGRSIPELIEFRDELDERVAHEDNLEEEISLLNNEITIHKTKLSLQAESLSNKRKKAAHRLEILIQEQLVHLGIPNALFIVKITHEENSDGDVFCEGKNYTAFERGYDCIEFLISTNSGEKPRPLVKVASGGEISRIMLALKSTLAESSQLPILVFDEIDTGISGRIAEAVGKSLKSLSRLHQIIAITHLPQIAAMANLHLSVKKGIVKERTVTEVTVLDHESRLHAIAALISGNRISPSSLTLANELIASAESV
ncbi:MAG: DNA repair protein RecN [Chlorobiaceae bacterium]